MLSLLVEQGVMPIVKSAVQAWHPRPQARASLNRLRACHHRQQGMVVYCEFNIHNVGSGSYCTHLAALESIDTLGCSAPSPGPVLKTCTPSHWPCCEHFADRSVVLLPCAPAWGQGCCVALTLFAALPADLLSTASRRLAQHQHSCAALIVVVPFLVTVSRVCHSDDALTSGV